MKILVIDDSKIERMIIRSYLHDLEYEIFDADSGEAGIELFNKHHPDIILLGVVMNGINGYEVVEQLRRQSSDWIPIIFLSGKAKAEDIMIGIQSGGDDYLAKPIHKQILIAKMIAMERIAAMRAQLIQVTENLQQANEELARQATLDGLTGISNRRHLDTTLTKEMARARRYNKPLTFMIADIDFFKKYNDYYGHIQGDECLKQVATALDESISRPGDLVARYGGEEFCMLLPNTDAEHAAQVADKLVNTVRRLELRHKGVSESSIVTMSFGVINLVPDNNLTPAEFIKMADEKLYQAKHNGRDQWIM